MKYKEIYFLVSAVIMIIIVGTIVNNVQSSPQTVYECNDRIDNDGDGYCDFYGTIKGCIDGSKKGDSGCGSRMDRTECTATTEICDGIDNDCDAQIDESLGSNTCGIGACQRTVNNCINGTTQICTPGNPTTEICTDNFDNDCDGTINNGCNQNSCTDSDEGFVIGTQGTISGYYYNNFYNYTDDCINQTTMLTENFCGGAYRNYYSIDCNNQTLGTTTCSNGACI